MFLWIPSGIWGGGCNPIATRASVQVRQKTGRRGSGEDESTSQHLEVLSPGRYTSNDMTTSLSESPANTSPVAQTHQTFVAEADKDLHLRIPRNLPRVTYDNTTNISGSARVRGLYLLPK